MIRAVRPSATRREIKFVDDDLDEARRVICRYVIIEAVRQERALTTILTCDEAGHPNPLRSATS